MANAGDLKLNKMMSLVCHDARYGTMSCPASVLRASSMLIAVDPGF